jgi:hypothetical protein
VPATPARTALEQRVETLERELEELKQRFDTFQRQFQ